MRRRRVIRATRATARAASWVWIWVVLGIIIVLFFVVRCMRWA